MGRSSVAAPGLATVEVQILEKLFEKVPDVVFFVKDREARYTSANRTLLTRCGIAHRDGLVGRTAAEAFPGPLGESYLAQDRGVLTSSRAVEDRLELHLYPGGAEGWCLTWKLPLPGADGRPRGLVGISRDLHRPDERHPEFRRLSAAVEALRRRHADEALRLPALARTHGLSMDRFERLVKSVFHLTPRQVLAKARVEAASRRLLATRDTIADVAHATGYADHSAFTRQFRAIVGLTPREFRSRASGWAKRGAL